MARYHYIPYDYWRFTPTAIKMILENFDCFNYEIFKKIYGINFNKEKYIQCQKRLKYILANYYHNPIKTQQIYNQNLFCNFNYSSQSRNSRDSTTDNSFNANDISGFI